MLRSAESVSAATGPSPALASSPRPALPFLAVTLALAALAFVTFAHPSASRIYSWPLSALTAALWLLPVGILLVTGARESTWRIPPQLLLTGLMLLAFATFASALFSPFSAASLARVWPTWSGVALYLYLHHACSASTQAKISAPHIAGLLAGAGVVFTAVSLALWSGGSWPLPWGSRNSAPFGHSTYTSGAIILLLPWIALHVFRTRRFVRVAWLLAVAAALAVLISTSSRGGVLALGVVIVAAALIAITFGRWSLQRKLILTAILLALGAGTVLANPRLRDLVLHRRWSESARESNAQRQAMLAAGFRLGAERPLLGWGPGTIPLAYPRVRARLDGATENVLQLHNTPAQVWATTGITGTLAMLLLIAGTAIASIRAPRTPVAFAATASLLGYAVVTLTDHQLDLPAMTALVAANLAILTAADTVGKGSRPVRRFQGSHAAPPRSSSETTQDHRIPTVPGVFYRPLETAGTPLRRGLVAVPVAITLAVVLPPTYRDLHARQLYDAALSALGRDERQQFVARLDQAAAVTPHDPFFPHHAAARLLDQRSATPDAARQLSLAREAASRLERSLTTGAHQEFAHFNLGWLYLELDRPADAARHFTAAARLVPDKGGVYFGLGLANEAAGRRDAAVRCFALEGVNDPRSLMSPAWETPALAALQTAVREEVIRLYPGLCREYPAARTIEAWTRWWWGEPVFPAELRSGFNAESTRFLAALPAIARRKPISVAGPRWAQAYAAWIIHSTPESRLSSSGVSRSTVDPSPAPSDLGPLTLDPRTQRTFLPAAQGDRAFAAALARRAHLSRDDFRQFLAAPTGDEPALLRTTRRQRIGYGMLALHPEGPPLHDLYVVQENRVLADLAAGLFPAKGWLPGRFLLARLPEEPW